jgi:excisionase family DNA binding protein
MTIDTNSISRRTVTVEEAGKMLGIGRNQAYEAARRGDLPVIKMGKRLLVPRAVLEKMLSGEVA